MYEDIVGTKEKEKNICILCYSTDIEIGDKTPCKVLKYKYTRFVTCHGCNRTYYTHTN